MTTARPSRRVGGFTLFEAGFLLLLVAGGVLLIRSRMEEAQETGIRGAAKAQLEERGFRVVSAEEWAETGSGYAGPVIFGVPRLAGSDGISSNTLDLIVVFEETRLLNLDWVQLDDAGLARLGHLNQLQLLSAAGSHVTDEGLAVAGSLPELKHLDLRSSCVRGPGLVHLKSLRHLEQLVLTQNELTDDCLPDLLELPALEIVSLNATFIEDFSVLKNRGILVADVETDVTLDLSQMPQATADTWAKLKGLSSHPDTQVQMILPPDGRVTSLRVRGANLNEQHLKSIAELTDLKNLDLAVSRFPDLAALDELGSLRNLRRIDLSRTTARDVFHEGPIWLSQIESLHIRGAGITDEDLKLISERMPNLRVLNLTRNPVSDDGLNVLAEMHQLEQLTLSRTKITGNGLKLLASLKKIRWLDLRDTDVAEDDTTALQTERPQLRILFGSR